MNFDQLSAVVADDQKSSRDIVSEILRSLSIRDIRHADDGAVAFHLLNDRLASFVVMDLEMPQDGVTTLRHIRKSENEKLRRTPVIMMTAMATHFNVEAMRDAGVNEVIVKPLTTAKLIGRIRATVLQPKPFVECASYIGPERRRANSQTYHGPLRRLSDRYKEVMEI